jgi:protein-disulfide isomerase
MPFVIDQNGDCRREVQADRALGDRMGIHSTPCVFVVTQQKWTYVTDFSRLSQTIEGALAETADVPKGGAAKG